MCPLRFILVFFSALLAGYFAWKSIQADDDDDDSLANSNDSTPPHKKQQDTNFIQMMLNGFWIFVDMASGRYLWRNLNKSVDQPSSYSSSSTAVVPVKIKTRR